MAKSLRIRLIKSPIGYNRRQLKTVKALGLGKLDSEIVQPDSPQIRGMVNSIRHLLAVEELDD
ncbi:MULTISPECIES: 50S ribosomal protein L30 [Mesotoga]|jgi:large subunit ribosomal protein L30|uniref:Large ribosomal subunit protein uL30 n=1 Tax=Mesotoga prima MesG1.Ag.4.2 TaxID=660470 RepID=I2F3A9_9BACT|nr:MULTISPECIES: 50S ribosomal protein L30 [Mesotoga]MCP5456950.1 50S ribosomal protein L30 [Thermotogota bacterium]CCU85953.1 50S ribosomal protein L30 [Mesotoga infera]AFK06412.1 ribosomal protein L30, bacterial/organelle [Mesotoga prima MesG1.Ag.4.2]MCB1222566.1 50S ribosomal protein L30 [Mesotoga sp.]MCP5461370.1 50S ribosomal protein L30 [Thermotogota bacterium]